MSSLPPQADPAPAHGPLTFSVLRDHGAPDLTPYRPAITSGPDGWRLARQLLDRHRDLLDLHDLQPIGEGAVGWVFRARQAHLRRTVAIKVCKSTGSDPARDPLRQQGLALARLDHPGIPRVLGSGNLGAGTRGGHRRSYLLLEWIDGNNLESLLRASDPEVAPTHQRLVAAIREVANALDHGHRRGVIHGDVRAANILVPTDPRRPALLLDWRGDDAPTSTAAEDRIALDQVLRQVLALGSPPSRPPSAGAHHAAG